MTARDDLAVAAAAEVDRWEKQLNDELLRLFDRQQAVVLARLQGTKARKHTRHWEPPGDRPLEVKQVIDPARWVSDAAGSLSPILGRLFAAVYKRVASQFGGADAPAGDDTRVAEAVQKRLDSAAQGVETAVKEVESYLSSEEDAGTPMPDIVAGVRDLYAQRAATWAGRIATLSAVGSINQAALFAASDNGSSAKQWLSRRDEKVRDTHVAADGQVRLLDEPFRLGGIPTHPRRSLLMFPGDPDPAVPADEVINCRCTMLFSPPKPASKALPSDADRSVELLEVKDRVRTPAGAEHYGQPIGSIIMPNAGPSLAPTFRAPSAGGSSAVPATSRPVKVGDVGGIPALLLGDDPAARALVAKYSQPGAVPDPAKTQILGLRDRKGRIGGYVVWQTVDGDQPKGTILAVSVHPSLQGHRVGDKMVQLVAGYDHDVKPTSRPATSAPVPARAASVANAPTTTRARAAGPRPIRDRTQPGDTPGTSGDFDKDAARIDRLQKAYLRDGADTTSLYQRGGRWSRDRERQQQAIIDHFLSQPGVKKDHQILILGGLPGAGKTTTINSPAGQAALGINLDDYVTVNADEVKSEMVKRGMVPDYPGLSADEAATLYHAESFEIAHSLMRQAARAKMNFAYDTSLKSSSQVGFATSAGSRTAPPPWQTTMLFVDVPPAVAKQRARDRYLAGGRYMPLGLIDGMRSSSRRFSSGPSEQFDRVKGSADRWVVVDNAGASPVVVGQGGKRGRTPRPPATPQASSAVSVPAATAAAPAPTSAAGAGLPAGLPPVPAGAVVYGHPSGKHIYVLPDGSMQVWKPDGKRGSSSATPQKLAAGHGQWTEVSDVTPKPASTGTSPRLVPDPKQAPVEQASTPPPAGAMPVAPMDFNEAPLSDVPKYIADPDYVFQQKVDGIRGVLVVEAGKAPWFASKKGDRLQSSTAAKITGPMLAKMPATPAGSPSYRVEGELLNGKFHVFDMIVTGQESTPYEQRKAMADAWVDAVAQSGLPQVEALPTARTSAEKQALWDKVVSSGAEGVMMKRRDAPYQGGQRVSTALKAKVTATADVVVLEKGVGGKDNARMGLAVGGKVVPIGTVSTLGKGPVDVGDVVEVEYLWATPGNTLAQPRIKRKRPDKTVADVTDASQLRQVDKTVLSLAAKSLRLALERKAGS